MNSHPILDRAVRLAAVPLAILVWLASAPRLSIGAETSVVSKSRGKSVVASTVRPVRKAGKRVPPRALASSSFKSARPVAGAGMVIGIDPATGEIGLPTAAQMAKLAALAQRGNRVTSGRPAPVYHPDGSISLDVRSWMRDRVVVRNGAGGKPIVGCVDASAPTNQPLVPSPATHAAPEER